MLLCALSADALESALQGIGSMSTFSDTLAGMYLAIAVNGQILDTEINTKHINRIIWRGFGNFYYDTEIEDSFVDNQIGLASDPIQPDLLVVSESDWDQLPAFKRDQRNIFKPFPGEDTLVIDNGPIRPELRLDRFISLVSFASLGYGPDSKLRGKTISLPDWIVDGLVDFNLVGAMHKENSVGNIIAGFVEPLHGIAEHFVLCRRWTQPYHQGLKHTIEYIVQWINNHRLVLGMGYAPLRPEDRSFRYPYTPTHVMRSMPGGDGGSDRGMRWAECTEQLDRKPDQPEQQ